MTGGRSPMSAVQASTDLTGSNRKKIHKKYELLFAHNSEQVLIADQQGNFLLLGGDVIEYQRSSAEYDLWMSEYNDYYHNRQ